VRGARSLIVVGALVAVAVWLRGLLGRGPRGPDANAGDDFEEPADVVHRTVVTSDGGQIHVVERGQGRPFVLLHGVTLTTASWQYQLVDLVDAGYRVLALDIRGHGRSRPGRDGYSLTRLAEDLREVLGALDVRDAEIVGHSLGGMTALQLLADHPELGHDGTVSGIVLVSTSAGMVVGNGVPALFARVAGLVTPAAAARGHVFASGGPSPPATRRHLFAGGGPSPPATRRVELASRYCRLAFGAAPLPTHVAMVRAITSAVPSDVLSPLIATLLRMDIRKQLGRLSVPTLVVVGRRDLVTPVWHSRYLASHIPGAQLVVLNGCGHLVLLERRAELADLLVGWARRGAGPGPGRGPQRHREGGEFGTEPTAERSAASAGAASENATDLKESPAVVGPR
jgi:pimeloyl-ACP methyl ester carboxylesterase